MTPETSITSQQRLTVDDIRHHAKEVRDMALSEIKTLRDEQGTRIAIIGIVAVVGVISLAYYLGTRSVRNEYGV